MLFGPSPDRVSADVCFAVTAFNFVIALSSIVKMPTTSPPPERARLEFFFHLNSSAGGYWPARRPLRVIRLKC